VRGFTPLVLALAALGSLTAAGAAEAAGPLNLTTERVAFNLMRPVGVVSPPGDLERIFVLEQHVGRIRILKNGVLLATPFLTIGAVNTGNEQGLLGLAFHPDYANNGRFFVNYTTGGGSGRTIIARYTVSGNPDVADPGSAIVLIDEPQPFSNHNGGWLGFGPNDGYLYATLGDGGSGGDPGNRAQDLGEILGKILRLDVDSASPYAIPPDNPFVGTPGAREEIWAYGLRNPWRASFDRLTGDLYVADVGQELYEEVSFQPASSTGGENYGWRRKEGFNCYSPSSGCEIPGLVDPIHEYSHPFSSGSITGGYVYRGCAIPELNGTYFFADYASINQIWSFRYAGAPRPPVRNRTAELAPGGGLSINSVSSFGEDAAGELYICDLSGGEVFKIVRRNDADVLVSLAPSALSVSSGATLLYDVTVENRTGVDQTVVVWIDAFKPPRDRAYAGNPVVGPRSFVIGAGRTVTRTASIRVPARVGPSGPYGIRVATGTFPATFCDTDCFKFNVVVP